MKMNKNEEHVCFELVKELVGMEETSILCKHDKDYFGILVQLVGYTEAKKLYEEAVKEYIKLKKLMYED
jgi:hypothetical protein